MNTLGNVYSLEYMIPTSLRDNIHHNIDIYHYIGNYNIIWNQARDVSWIPSRELPVSMSR